ncbi:hypothetical protein ACMF93_001644 [Campylobacter jejuni]
MCFGLFALSNKLQIGAGYLTLICGILGLFFMSGAYDSMQESVPT